MSDDPNYAVDAAMRRRRIL